MDINNLNVTIQNGSAGLLNISANVPLIGTIFMVIIILGILLFGTSYLFLTLQRFKKLLKFLKFLSETAYYFGYGLLAIFTFGLPTYLIYLFIKETSSGNFIPIKWIFIILSGYSIVCYIGWLYKRFIINKIKIYLK